MVYIYMCVWVCVSFVLSLSVGSRVSLSSPNLISVKSANTVSGRYAYTRDPLQLLMLATLHQGQSLICLAKETEFIAAHPDQEYASYVHTGLLSGFRMGFDCCSGSLQSFTRNQ